MSRKIISLVEHHGYCFKHHEQRFLETEKEVDGILFPVGHLDFEWEKEKLPIYLANIDNKDYYSVVQETTIEMLYEGIINSSISQEEYDIKIEDEISNELLLEIFRLSRDVRDKYSQDKNYLTYLGLPDLPEEEQPESETETLPEE